MPPFLGSIGAADGPKRGWRTPGWKYAIDFLNPGRVELYDLRNDPTESDDRAAAYPRRLERMVRAWQAYAEQNGVAVYDRDLGYGRYFRRQQ